jgi:hypothetical protein
MPVRPLLVALTAVVAGGGQFTVRPAESRVTVAGTSTVRSWSCTATAFDASVTAAGVDAAGVASGGAVATAARFVVPVGALDCRNGTMNDHLRKALKAAEHPQVVFAIADYALAGGDARLRGTLRIAGQDVPVVVVAQVTAEGDALRVRGTHVVEMATWGVKPPTLMLGTLKVGPAVTVAFDLKLAP